MNLQNHFKIGKVLVKIKERSFFAYFTKKNILLRGSTKFGKVCRKTSVVGFAFSEVKACRVKIYLNLLVKLYTSSSKH